MKSSLSNESSTVLTGFKERVILLLHMHFSDFSGPDVTASEYKAVGHLVVETKPQADLTNPPVAGPFQGKKATTDTPAA